ncbi:MAG: N-acetylmuramoyl-L-alanine amidase [Solibacillus sp.]
MNQKFTVWFVAFLLLTTLIVKPASASVVFADVATTSDTYEEIQYLINLGAIKGYEENGKTYYKPNVSVTRGQAAKMVVVASGNKPLTVSTSSYRDVKVGTEVSTYIERARQLGFFEQRSGNFKPNEPLTREEMSYVLSKAFHLDASLYSNVVNPFPDVSDSNTYSSYIKAIYYNGITKGSNGNYMPKNSVTRAQFASFIARSNEDKFRLAKPAVPEAVDTSQVIGTIAVTTDGLNIRTAPNMSSQILGKVNKGGKLSVYDVDGVWLKVSYQGQYAYIGKTYAQFLDADGQGLGSADGTVRPTEKLNVYTKATSTAKANNTVDQGDTLNVYGEKNGYYLVAVDGLPGYVLKSKTVINSGFDKEIEVENPPAASGETPLTGTQAKVTIGGLHVREKMSSSSTSLMTLKKGAVIAVHSIDGYWAKVTANDKTGYVHKSYVKLINTSGSKVKNRIIILDPGHGGKDPGAVNGSNTEKAIVLKVTNLVREKLEAAGANVFMTRTGDTYPTLPERVAFTKDKYGEMFISIHVNSATSTSAKGTETFYSVTSGDQYAEDAQLAKAINSEIVKNANMRDRGVKQADYYVIRNMMITSVLVELGFISNSEDRAKLISDKYVEIYAQSIYDGIVDYYKN